MSSKALNKEYDLASESTDDFGDDLSSLDSNVAELLDTLRQIESSGYELTEATLVANVFYTYGMRFTHYGFVLPTSNSNQYLSLDFSRKGIVWETWEEFPGMPDNTFLVEKYNVDSIDAWRIVAEHCRHTQPFNYFFNDCKAWCDGLKTSLNMELAADESPSKGVSKGLFGCGDIIGLAEAEYA